MQISMNHPLPNNPSGVYATEEDFCRLFSEDMKSLYLLCLLLTADHEKAEQCFVTGIERCSTGGIVFKEWAHSWARRIIVQNAIRMISPTANGTLDTASLAEATVPGQFENQAFLFAITRLPAFDRFAFVISTLERFPDKDCCALLACSRRDLIQARSHALELLPTSHYCAYVEKVTAV